MDKKWNVINIENKLHSIELEKEVDCNDDYKYSKII
jgi:hypothetical protein